MIKFFSIFLTSILLYSCGSEDNSSETKQADNFTISGSIADAANSSLYLEALSQEGSIAVSETKINSDGTFKLTGNIPGLGIYQLRLGEAKDKIIPLTLVPNDKLKVNTSFTDFTINPVVSGTEWASVMNSYMRFYAVFNEGQRQLSQLEGKATEEELMALYLELRKPLDKFSIDQMKKDPDNPYNIVLSTSATPITGFKDWDPANIDVLKIVSEAYKKRYKDSPMAATMENQVFQIESAYNEFKASQTGVNRENNLAPEIGLKNPAGKIIKLSSLRGKVVLIDFWASWCGPCRKENPTVVRLYKQYKDKGFTVFSVSLDDNAEAWKKAITDDGLIWPNHVSDLFGWKTPMTQLYGFNSIPHTVLIDKEGKIIGTGLRGESLEQKLKEIFSK